MIIYSFLPPILLSHIHTTMHMYIPSNMCNQLQTHLSRQEGPPSTLNSDSSTHTLQMSRVLPCHLTTSTRTHTIPILIRKRLALMRSHACQRHKLISPANINIVFPANIVEMYSANTVEMSPADIVSFFPANIVKIWRDGAFVAGGILCWREIFAAKSV